MNRVWRLAPAVILTLLVPTASLADEPVPDTADHGEADNGVSPAEVEEAEEGWGIYFPEWFDLDAEYRVRTLRIDPLELNGDTVRDVTWTEQRARLDAQFIYPGVGRLVLQADILDGVLFGDNGTFGTDIIPTSGVSLLTRTPNNLAPARRAHQRHRVDHRRQHVISARLPHQRCCERREEPCGRQCRHRCHRCWRLPLASGRRPAHGKRRRSPQTSARSRNFLR